MKILFTGKPNNGSWQIRAVQMAEGFAQCIPFATEAQCREADFIVAVKRTPQQVLDAIRASGRPWAWDVVDAYPQPTCTAWGRGEAVSWMRAQVRALRPTVACWATKKMMVDVDMGGAVVYHHHRPVIDCNPIRDKITVIGYEGARAALGSWARVLHKAAAHVGAKFTDDPARLSDCDVVTAFRGETTDCYATRNWKSNVKLANAHASGTPFIGQESAGYLETATGAECWANDFDGVVRALERLTEQSERARVAETFRSAQITRESCQEAWLAIARRYA